MQSELTKKSRIFVSTELGGRRETRSALQIVLVSFAFFLAAAPFAKTQLVQVQAFIPSYASALVICDLITAVLLFSQFNFLRSRALLVIASGYLFNAAMAALHLMTFPGVLSPTGLLGAGPQSAAWLYLFWHAGFPLVVIAYAFLKNEGPDALGTARLLHRYPTVAILCSAAAVLAVTAGLALLVTEGEGLLPILIQANSNFQHAILSVCLVLSIVAIAALWRRRPLMVLDLWLMVVMCAWLFEVALSAVLNDHRYDLGWYAGRIYGLLAAAFLLVVLLIENNRHYARLVHMSELENTTSIAEAANLAKSDFLSSMSHELRTPLNAILGFAQLMETGLPEPTPTQKRNLGQITKAGWYLLELINEILDLAQIETEKLQLSLEPMSLTEVARECQAMIDPLAQKRNIRVIVQNFEAAYFVTADRTRVRQVLVNLLSNAIKYNRVGGTVELDFTVTNEQYVRISVRDTGEGLTSDKLTQLFQPFNRLGKETGVEEGTGIGLVVSKRLVELMGGKIGVESTVGRGSLFWIELKQTAEPLPVAPAAPPEAVARVHAGASLRTLLYVEDNPANLMLVEDLIARLPHINLLSATNGQRGIEIARATLPDVILMDINLPGISGIQAMRILANDPATAHIPVIALSANAIPRDIDSALKAGFFGYLTKPIKISKFMDTLDEALKLLDSQSAHANTFTLTPARPVRDQPPQI